MSRNIAQPERLFDRPWRSGQPLQPRISAVRRWGMRLLLAVLLLIIGAYMYYTDSRRVRDIAETYLSRVLNAHVTVGEARLSIFEGLRLEDVAVHVDDSGSPDSTIFTAESFRIDYSPQSILGNRLEARRIIAISPHVRLTENLDTGQWNYQRLIREAPPEPPATRPSDEEDVPLVLPEIILRNARIDYTEISGGQSVPRGSMAAEGRLFPAAEPGRYAFELQSRGPTAGLGAIVNGSFTPATGQFTMRLRNFDFDHDVLAMMPAQVRQWCIDHQLAGRVDIPELSYTPARRGRPAMFRVVTEMHGVRLAVHPREWRSRRENEAQHRIDRVLHLLRLGSLRTQGMFASIAEALRPQPVRLDSVSGTLIFHQDGIEIRRLTGRLEANGFKIAGRIDGYSPDATVRIELSSLDNENIFIPQSPRYIASLPGPVREVYGHLQPVGSARLMFELVRDQPGGRPKISGYVEIVNGQFTFDRFPYPLRNVTGRIVLGTDPVNGWEQIELQDLRGYGVSGGPNASKLVQVKGTIGPLGPESAVHIEVSGKNIVREPALMAALPSQAVAALSALDAEGEGNWPTFRVDFLCDVRRPLGRNTRWTVNTDLLVHEAAGRLKQFPYPLEGLSGIIRVREGRLEIIDGAMRRGQAELAFSGDFTWDTQRDEGQDQKESAASPPENRPLPNVRPNLKITARHVPIDADLIAALPPDHRPWIERLGATGRIDIDGAVLPADPEAPDKTPGDYHFDFDLTLHDATLLPIDGQPLFTQAAGRLRITPQRVVVSDLTARRDQSRLKADGVATWVGKTPHLRFSASASNLELDSGLYVALPPRAREAWDQVQPEGSIDVRLTYSGDVSLAENQLPTTQPAAQKESTARESGFELTIRPRTLSVQPQIFPLRLEEVAGTVILRGEELRMESLTATHGGATYALSGEAHLGEEPIWTLHLKADGVDLDDTVRQALPEALSTLTQTLEASGRMSIDFPKVVYRPGQVGSQPLVSVVDLDRPATQPVPDSRLDFEGMLTLDTARLDVGVVLDQVKGTLGLNGRMDRGELSTLRGDLKINSLQVAARQARNISAELTKPEGQPALRIEKLRGELAGGEVAGTVLLTYPKQTPSRFAMDLALHEADVRQVAGETERNISGRLSASLALEGAWGDLASRRGRGEVNVAGEEMYQIPVVLGLIEITNLALPINSPFKTATTRYSVAGNTVTFEQIELRSDQMRMAGSGSLNFETQRVGLTFTTDNPNWPKLPIVGDLIQGARNEMLQIRVTGTIQKPKVSASSLNTFQTTIDEVVKGN